LSINPHFSTADCPPPDILLIPGGIGTRRLLEEPVVLNWIKFQAERVQLLLSVCTGALLLGQAGLLNQIPATTHHTTFDLLREISPATSVIEDQRFVDSGHIITSGGISAGIDMALYVVRKFLSEAQVDLVIKEMEYQWHQK